MATAEPGLEFFQGQEDFAVVIAWVVLRFNVYGTDQAAVLSSAHVLICADVGVIKAKSGRLGDKRNAPASMRRNKRSAFFRRPIDVG